MRNTTHFDLSRTVTFRRGSRAVLGYWGTNLQNPSGDMCEMYPADPGKAMIQVDQSGADAKCVAYLCPDGNFRQLFLNAIKPHVFVAMHIFKDHWAKNGHPYVMDYCKLKPRELPLQAGWKALANTIKNHERYYFIGKKTCHSANYRMQASTFRFDILEASEGVIVLTLKEAELFLSMYHDLFPEIKQVWHKEIERDLNETRTLRTLQGYPRYFGQAWSEALLREATAFVPQGTVAIITALAVQRLQTYIEEKGKDDWDILNDKHDSYLGQCNDNPDNIEEMKTVMLDFMQQELVSPRGEKFKMGAAASVGYNWGKFDVNNPEKNPKGLKEL